MAENNKINRHIFISTKSDEYKKEDVNEKLVLTNDKITVGENEFNASSAYKTNDNKDVLQFRDIYDESSNINNVGTILEGRTTTKIGEVTVSKNFSYNGGSSKNIPNYYNSKSSPEYTESGSKTRKENIYKVGSVTPNSLRNLENEEQEI